MFVTYQRPFVCIEIVVTGYFTVLEKKKLQTDMDSQFCIQFLLFFCF